AVAGVVLKDGEEIAAEAVVSGVDPKRTFFTLLDPAQLEPGFAQRMKNLRAKGTVAKVNLALGDLPSFPSLVGTVGPDGFRAARRVRRDGDEDAGTVRAELAQCC